MNNSKSFLGHYNHYIVMFFIMIFAGLLSTMNTYTNKLDDIRFSLNDFSNDRINASFYGNLL